MVIKYKSKVELNISRKEDLGDIRALEVSKSNPQDIDYASPTIQKTDLQCKSAVQDTGMLNRHMVEHFFVAKHFHSQNVETLHTTRITWLARAGPPYSTGVNSVTPPS